MPIAAVLLAAAFVALSPSAHAARAGVMRAATPASRVARGMAVVPAGRYRPLYAPVGSAPVRVRAFALDRTPVTRGRFLAFVSTHPEWRAGSVPRERADAGYLADWTGPLDAGRGDELRRPVTSVSWFAARAYCAASGRRLPTLDEWELAALASPVRRDASGDPAHRRRLAALYAARRPGAPGVVGRDAADVHGVHDLHGLVWELTLDFNPGVVAAAARTGGGRHPHAHRLSCASAAIGAADPTDYPAFARSANRAGLTARSTVGGTGFRCAADLPA
jgi:formylglycine-generating enzyme required for sulfatase activity